MRTNYIFIIGVQKAGTTALAGWLVRNGFAAYAVPDVKEPGNFLRFGLTSPLPPPRGDVPLLDASTGYFGNRKVVSRMPEHRVRVAVCLRNPLERTWSAYRMMKLITQQGAGADAYLQRFHAAAETPQALERAAWYQARRELTAQGFPRISARAVERHFDAEAERLRSGTFLQRLQYELGFYLARREFPFFSVLAFSFYYRGLRMLIEKYQQEDIVILSMDRMANANARGQMVERLTGRGEPGPELGVSFSLDDLAFDEPTPDFSSPDLANFRNAFAFDLDQTLAMLARHHVATDLVNEAELRRHLG